MKKKWFYISGFFVLVLILIYAFPFKKEKDISVIKFPLNYEKKFNTIEFKTKIIAPNELIFKSKAKMIPFDEKIVIPYVFQEEIGSKRIKVNDRNYIHDNGKSLYIYNNYLSYNSNSSLHYAIASSFSLFKEKYTADKFHIKSNIETSEINKNLKEELSKINIKNIDFFKCFELDAQTLKNNEKHIDKNGNNLPDKYKMNWEKEDNSTYWLGTEKCQELPVFGTSFSVGIDDTWAPIQILYTKDGIEKIQILYYFDFIELKEPIILKSFDKIAEALEEEYSLLLTDNKYIVTTAKLYFWVNINETNEYFDMVPVWVLTLEEKGKNEKENIKIQEIINAETAENLEMGD